MKVSGTTNCFKKWIFSAVTLTYGLLNAATLNVSNYGVTGNGTTDDSTALQNAFDAAASSTPKPTTLQIPANYIIKTTKNLFIHGEFDLEGLDNSPVILCDADLSNDLGRQYWISVGITGHKNNGGYQDSFVGIISNLCFKASSNAKFQRGVLIFNTTSTIIDNVVFDFKDAVAGDVHMLFGAVETGYDNTWEPAGAKTLQNIAMTNNTVMANHSVNGSEGLGANSAANVTISNNYIYGVGDDAIGCHNIAGLTIKGNYCYSIDGRILTNNCTDVEISNNYCERIPEYGTNWYGVGALIMAGLEANNSWPAPANILIKNNTLVIPAQVPSIMFGIRLKGVRAATVTSNLIYMNSPNGGGGINIEADTSFPGWTDPTGIDADHIARPRDTTITNNICTGSYPGKIYQNGLMSDFPGSFYNLQGNIAGSYLWYSNYADFENSNIIGNGNYSVCNVSLTAIENPVNIFTDNLLNVKPGTTVTGITYTAVKAGRISGYNVALSESISTGWIFLQLWKNGSLISSATRTIFASGNYSIPQGNIDVAFYPGDTFLLKAIGSSNLFPSSGINIAINVKGLEPTVVAYYDFDSDSSSTVFDHSGNGNNGIITGATRVAGIVGGDALKFDGNDYVTVADHNSLDISDNLTISFWINASALPDGYAAHLVKKFTSTANGNFACYYHGSSSGAHQGKIGFVATAGGTWKPISQYKPLPQNQWVHVALTYNSTTGGQLYLNGVATGSRTGGGTLAVNADDLIIGYNFKGMIDDVKIFNRELTANEILNDSKKINHGQLVSHWKFNEGFGQTTGDSSGNDFDGTIIGATWDSGVAGEALTFDGNSYVTVADNNKLDICDYLTVSFWINASALPDGVAGYPIKKNTVTTDANFACYHFGTTAGTDQGKIGFLATAGGTWKAISQYADLPQDQWVHVALTYNSITGGQLYINGVATGSRTGGGTLAVNIADLVIGSAIKGKLDEVRIYNRELSAVEIKGLYYMNK